MKKLIIISLISLSALFLLSCETDPRIEQSSFSAGEDVLKRSTDENFLQEAAGVESTGVTYYSSSNETVAAVDPYTGEIKILSAGISRITASNAGDVLFKPATAMYKLTVTNNAFICTFLSSIYNGNTITIPVFDAYDYDYIIDWGDGGTTIGSSKTITHQYESTGIYTVSISGTFPGICFNNESSGSFINSIENWGIIEWQSMNGAFYGCGNLKCNALDFPNVSKVTDMDNTFNGAEIFSSQDLSNWDVSQVTTHTDFSTGWGFDNTEPNWP